MDDVGGPGPRAVERMRSRVAASVDELDKIPALAGECHDLAWRPRSGDPMEPKLGGGSRGWLPLRILAVTDDEGELVGFEAAPPNPRAASDYRAAVGWLAARRPCGAVGAADAWTAAVQVSAGTSATRPWERQGRKT